MKTKDISLIVVIGIVSAVVSLIFSNIFLSSPEDRVAEVEIVEPISAEFNRPSNEYFNDSSVNPTRTIEIRQDPGSNPFSEQ